MATLHDYIHTTIQGKVFVDSHGKRYSVQSFDSGKNNTITMDYGGRNSRQEDELIPHLHDEQVKYITPEEVDILARHAESKLEQSTEQTT